MDPQGNADANQRSMPPLLGWDGMGWTNGPKQKLVASGHTWLGPSTPATGSEVAGQRQQQRQGVTRAQQSPSDVFSVHVRGVLRPERN